MDLLKGLNKPQQEAVMHINGPLLVLAGAGSGKTSVLTRRVAHLLEEGVRPHQILAITFTNKAAGEMRERVKKIVGDVADKIMLSTFHSFCAKLLRTESTYCPYVKSNFTILDDDESVGLIKDCMLILDIDVKKIAPRSIKEEISRCKNLLISYHDEENTSFLEQEYLDVYKLYQEKLELNNCCDFDDLLFYSADLFLNHPEILTRYQDRFRYLLIDEYQDTNHVQYVLANLMAKRHRNIFIVGDIDQSIYAFRQADISNILNFEKDYPEAKIIKLEQNYRSSQYILDAANAVIENNLERKPKTLWTAKKEGEPLTWYEALDDKDEAIFISSSIDDLHQEKDFSYNDFCILVRTNAQSRSLEEALMRRGIPYIIVGGLKFYDRKEIKDMIAYLRFLVNPSDNIALARIINTPKRGIGNKSITKIFQYAEDYKLSFEEAMDAIGADIMTMVPKKAAGELLKFLNVIQEARSMSESSPIGDVVRYLMDATGYLQSLENSKESVSETRIENLFEFVSVARDFTFKQMELNEDVSLQAFLNHISLISDIDTADLSDDRVSIMTIHGSKGLEFPVVFIAGMEEGLFPHGRSLMSSKDIEEERRLCYVAITRAKELLFLSSAESRRMFDRIVYNSASRFIDEIPAELIVKKSFQSPRYSFN